TPSTLPLRQAVGMATMGSVVGTPVVDPPASSIVIAIVSPASIDPSRRVVVTGPAASNVPAETGVPSPRTNHISNVSPEAIVGSPSVTSTAFPRELDQCAVATPPPPVTSTV